MLAKRINANLSWIASYPNPLLLNAAPKKEKAQKAPVFLCTGSNPKPKLKIEMPAHVQTYPTRSTGGNRNA